MSGTSLAGLLTICGVIVIGLATWIGLVFSVNSHPRWKRAQKPLVQILGWDTTPGLVIEPSPPGSS